MTVVAIFRFSSCLALAVLASAYVTVLLAIIPCGFFFNFVAPSATAETFRMEKLTGCFLMLMHSAFFSIGSLVGSLVGGAPSTVGSSSSLGLSRDSWYWNACGLVTLEDLFAVRASNSYTGASIATARSAGPETRRSWYSQSEQDWYCPRLVCALVNTGHVRIHGLRRGDCFCIQPV